MVEIKFKDQKNNTYTYKFQTKSGKEEFFENGELRDIRFRNEINEEDYIKYIDECVRLANTFNITNKLEKINTTILGEEKE